MSWYIIKILITALVVLAVSEISKRLPLLGSLIASLPLISVLGMIIILTFFWKLNLEHADYLENQPNVAITKKILALLVIPLIIYQMILSTENKKVKRFNSYKIK